MSTLTNERATHAEQTYIENGFLCVRLTDQREIRVPLSWYPRLVFATAEELAITEIHGAGEAIYWPVIDEGISVEGIIAGRCSMEGPNSFKKWQNEMRERRQRAAAKGEEVNLEPWGEQLPMPAELED